MMKKVYLVRIDISGIQNFIFDIKSDGAAKALKAKSLFVLKLGQYIVKTFQNVFDDTHVFYEGGGNALISVKTDDEQISTVVKHFQTINEEGLQVAIAYSAFEDKDFKSISVELMSILNIKKNRQFFETHSKSLKNLYPWEKYADHLFKAENFSFKLKSHKDYEEIPVIISDLAEDPIMITPRKGLKNLDFTEIARDESIKGADYIGALKMDIDNLGSVFEKIDNTSSFQLISNLISKFFKEEIHRIINTYYKNKIYVVFSGGDDCFFIGKWSILIHLAIEIRDNFDKYVKEAEKKETDFQGTGIDQISLSASVVIANHKFPMSKIGYIAEEELHNAKYNSKNKNSISIFGYVLGWSELLKAKELMELLVDLVENKDESRSLIQYVIKSHKGFEPLLRNAKSGKVNIPKVWRLKYYLRNIKTNNENTVEEIFSNYEKAIIDAFMGRNNYNPDLYIVAARWAELLTKNKESENA